MKSSLLYSYQIEYDDGLRTFMESVEQMALAEEYGFDTVLVSEHHLVENGYFPAPMVTNGAIAMRTRFGRLCALRDRRRADDTWRRRCNAKCRHSASALPNHSFSQRALTARCTGEWQSSRLGALGLCFDAYQCRAPRLQGLPRISPAKASADYWSRCAE